MKNFFFLLSLFLIAFQVFAASDWSPPSSTVKVSGKLTVESTSKASRPYPSMTTTQRDALTATEGETIYNSTTGKLNIYSSSKWGEVSGSGGGSGGIDFLAGQNFDSGVSAWTGSGTFTATTTPVGAGAYWSITGTGTRELVVNTSSYSGSQVWLSIYTNSTDSNLYLCVVQTSENCVQNTVEAGWKKLQVQFTASSTATIRLKSLSASFNGYFAAVKIEPYTPNVANLVEQASAKHVGTGLLTTTGVIRLPTTQIGTSIGSSITYNSADGRFTATKKTTVFVNATYVLTSSGAVFTIRKNGITTLISSSPSAAGGYQSSLGGSFEMSAGDYFDIYTASTISDNSNSFFSISATAIRDNVVQAWQDGTEWTDYTPTFSAGFGTVTNAAGKWKRSGSDLEVFVSCTTGTTGASLATVTLPNGLSIDASKLTINNTTSNGGTLVGTYNGGTSAGNIGSIVTAPSTSTSLFYFGTKDANASSHLTPANGNIISNSSAVFSFYAKVPIQGWSSTPTLLALPTSKENVFSAKISSAGAILSQSSDWIDSITKNGTGDYTINFTKLGLSVTPAVSAIFYSSIGVNDTFGTSSNTASTARVTYVRNGTAVDIGFNIILQKQSPDYQSPGVFVGNVAKNQVATIEYWANGSPMTLTTSSQPMPITRVTGDTSIVSHALNRFTLQAGEYEIQGDAVALAPNAAAYIFNYLLNYTDGVEVKRGFFVGSSGGIAMFVKPSLPPTRVSLTKATTFEWDFYINSSSGYTLGHTTSAPNDLAASIKITKLNGQ